MDDCKRSLYLRVCQFVRHILQCLCPFLFSPPLNSKKQGSLLETFEISYVIPSNLTSFPSKTLETSSPLSSIKKREHRSAFVMVFASCITPFSNSPKSPLKRVHFKLISKNVLLRRISHLFCLTYALLLVTSFDTVLVLVAPQITRLQSSNGP